VLEDECMPFVMLVFFVLTIFIFICFDDPPISFENQMSSSDSRSEPIEFLQEMKVPAFSPRECHSCILDYFLSEKLLQTTN